jgi:hypothetical protein
MNQKTQAFLTQLAALCDAHGVEFYADRDGAVQFTGGGLEITDESPTPTPIIWIGLYSLAEIKDLLWVLDNRASR